MRKKLSLGIGKTNLTEQIPTENLNGVMIDCEIGAYNLQRGVKGTHCLCIGVCFLFNVMTCYYGIFVGTLRC